MKHLLFAVLWAGILSSAPWERPVVIREYRGKDGSTVFIRATCKKVEDGKPGVRLTFYVNVFNFYGEYVGGPVHSGRDQYCPTPADVDAFAKRNYPALTPVDTLARSEVQTTPADGRLYIADSTGPDGRTSVAVLDAEAMSVAATIDVDDRLFGGLQLAPSGERVYALLWPRSLGTPAPAQIAYLDTATNAVVDRFELPGLLEPQAPALSRDGRYLYFSARTETGPFRIRVADLQAKTVAMLPDPVPANTEMRAVSLSPDGALLCAAGASSLSCYDTRSRTFAGRVFVSLPNASLRPVFHPNGGRIYLLGRAFVNNVLSIHILVVDTGSLTEIARIPIVTPPASGFRDNLAVLAIDPTGSRLFLDEGFAGVLNMIDTRTNRVSKTVEGLTTGGLGGTILTQ